MCWTTYSQVLQLIQWITLSWLSCNTYCKLFTKLVFSDAHVLLLPANCLGWVLVLLFVQIYKYMIGVWWLCYFSLSFVGLRMNSPVLRGHAAPARCHCLTAHSVTQHQHHKRWRSDVAACPSPRFVLLSICVFVFVCFVCLFSPPSQPSQSLTSCHRAHGD